MPQMWHNFWRIIFTQYLFVVELKRKLRKVNLNDWWWIEQINFNSFVFPPAPLWLILCQSPRHALLWDFINIYFPSWVLQKLSFFFDVGNFIFDLSPQISTQGHNVHNVNKDVWGYGHAPTSSVRCRSFVELHELGWVAWIGWVACAVLNCVHFFQLNW